MLAVNNNVQMHENRKLYIPKQRKDQTYELSMSDADEGPRAVKKSREKSRVQVLVSIACQVRNYEVKSKEGLM